MKHHDWIKSVALEWYARARHLASESRRLGADRAAFSQAIKSARYYARQWRRVTGEVGL